MEPGDAAEGLFDVNSYFSKPSDGPHDGPLVLSGEDGDIIDLMGFLDDVTEHAAPAQNPVATGPRLPVPLLTGAGLALLCDPCEF